MQANLDQISRKNEEVSTKLDQITPGEDRRVGKEQHRRSPHLG